MLKQIEGSRAVAESVALCRPGWPSCSFRSTLSAKSRASPRMKCSLASSKAPTMSGSPCPYQASMLISTVWAHARLTKGTDRATPPPTRRKSLLSI